MPRTLLHVRMHEHPPKNARTVFSNGMRMPKRSDDIWSAEKGWTAMLTAWSRGLGQRWPVEGCSRVCSHWRFRVKPCSSRCDVPLLVHLPFVGKPDQHSAIFGVACIHGSYIMHVWFALFISHGIFSSCGKSEWVNFSRESQMQQCRIAQSLVQSWPWQFWQFQGDTSLIFPFQFLL